MSGGGKLPASLSPEIQRKAKTSFQRPLSRLTGHSALVVEARNKERSQYSGTISPATAGERERKSREGKGILNMIDTRRSKEASILDAGGSFIKC